MLRPDVTVVSRVRVPFVNGDICSLRMEEAQRMRRLPALQALKLWGRAVASEDREHIQTYGSLCLGGLISCPQKHRRKAFPLGTAFTWTSQVQNKAQDRAFISQ